jgi:hypothetical protein
MEATGATSATASSEAKRCTQERLDVIQAQAKRLCASVTDEISHLQQLSDKAVADGENAEKKQAAAYTEAEAAHVYERAQLEADRSALKEEIDAMRGTQHYADTIVLNVGGTRFETSKLTVCKHAGTFLEAMFSGRHAHKPQIDGAFFIDRDPTHFRLILNFLRCGAAVSPDSAAAKAEAAEEALFYGLPSLHRALTAPLLDLDSALGHAICQSRALEMQLRARFVKRDEHDGSPVEPPAPHEGLLSFFRGGEDSPAATLRHDRDPAEFPLLLSRFSRDASRRQQPGSGTLLEVACSTLKVWRTNFSFLHSNLLNRLAPLLAEGKLFVAGGSVLHALTHGQRLGSFWGPTSDVDLFLHSCTADEATALTRRVFDAVATDNESWTISRGRGVISMLMHTEYCEGPNHNGIEATVQVILRLYDSPAEVLCGFDVDCCCCGYDGSDVWMLPRCLRALRHSVNILNPLHAWPVRCACTRSPPHELRVHRGACQCPST